MTAASLSFAVPPRTGSPQVILLATDFCAPAQHALACARQIARLRGAAVRALHVMDLSGTTSDDGPCYSVVHDSAESRLRDVRRELRLGCVPESATLVTAGRPARAIRQAAAEYGASLLILGVNGSRSRKASTLGSTARALLSCAPCPVLTVRPLDAHHSCIGSCTAERPLFITDTAPESLRAGLVAWPSAKNSQQIRVALPPDGKRRLQLDPATPLRFASAHVLELPDAAFTLLREAADTRVGIMVLALRSGSYLDSFATGSFAHTLITKAACPVLTVRC